MRKLVRSSVGLLTVTVMLVAWAVAAGANLVAPTPANGSTISGTVTLTDDGSQSGGINLLLTSCNGSTNITVAGTSVNVTANGSGGASPGPSVSATWVTENTANGNYTITGTDVKKTSVCFGTSTSHTTSTVTVRNVSSLAYGGDTSAPVNTVANVKATITDQSNVALPAGQPVTFTLKQGTTTIGTAAVNTTAGGIAATTMAVSATATPGPATLTAAYNGTYFTPVSQDIPFTVAADPTSTGLVSSANPSVFGNAVHFTATVTSNLAGQGTPTGNVAFTVDGNPLSSGAVNGSGVATSANISSLIAGGHPVIATFTGTGKWANSTSTTLNQTVNQATTSIGLTPDPSNPTVFGQPVQFHAHVSVVTGAGTPTGSVTFQANGSPIGGAVNLDASGNATSDPTTSLDVAHSPFTIKAVYGGDHNFAGSNTSIQQTVNKATTAATLSSSSEPSVSGQSVSFSTTVSAVSPGAGTPTGFVQFKIDGTPFGSQVQLSTSGQATSNSIGSLTPGPHSIEVDYLGDSNFDGVTQTTTQTVNQAATTISISSSANPSVFGQAVNFSAHVAVVAPGSGSPSGTVTFTVDGHQLGNPNFVDGAGNASSDITSALSVGDHTVVATYNGDTNFSGSNDQLTQSVNRAATTTALSSSINPTVFGQDVTFTANIAVTAPGAGTPTGTITFSDGSTQLAVVNLTQAPNAGTASFTTTALSVGTHAVTATYSGDGNFVDSSGSLTQTVNQAQSSTTVTQNGTIVQGQPVSFTATVAAVAPGVGLPTGTVRFFLNGAPQGSPVAVDGSGHATSANINGLTPGNFTITATYSGDTNFLTSSGSIGQAVGPASTTTGLVITSTNPSAYGTPVSLQAHVAPVAPATGSPSGTVDFYDGSVLIGTGSVDGSGNATFTTGTIAVGGHNFTATYLGDTSFTTSSSSTVVGTVNGDPTSTSLASSPNPSTYGGTVTLKATVTKALANAVNPGGSVSFFDGATLLGTVPVSNSGGTTATLGISTLAAGPHTLKATYSGDANYGTSTSTTVSQTVNKAPTTLTKASTNTTNLSATLTWAGGPLAGQSITFKSGTTTLCIAPTDSSGKAVCQAGSGNLLTIELHGFQVSYAGNSNFLGSSA